MTSAAAFPASAPGFNVPENAVDCHIHIIGTDDQFPFTPLRSYTVPPATVSDFRKVAHRIGISRAVVVQPSIYGYDNACMISALKEFGANGRGVAVVAPDTPAGEIERLHAAGVRGARVNLYSLQSSSGPELEHLITRTAATIADMGWHLQLLTMPEVLVVLANIQSSLPCPIVIDHFGLIQADTASAEPMTGYLKQLHSILDYGGWIKLSGLYRVAEDPMSANLKVIARDLFNRAPDRVVWGSDWPHTPEHSRSVDQSNALTPYRGLDTGSLLAPVASWLDNEGDRKRLLVTNPGRLYDFVVE